MTRIASMALILIAVLSLVGWTLDVEPLKRIRPELIPMMPPTAVGFLLAGISLGLSRDPESPDWRVALGRAGAAALVLLGIVVLLEHLLGIDRGIDYLLFPEAVAQLEVEHPGRPAQTSSVGMILSGVALLLVARRGRRSTTPSQVLALCVVLLALPSLVGYLYDAEEVYDLAGLVPMAFHAAVGFVVLGLGLLFARPDQGPVAVLTDDDLGGRLARRLLPAAILLPLLLGWFRIRGEQAALFGSQFGVTLLITVMMVAFSGLVWWNTGTLRRIGAARRRLIEREMDARQAVEAARGEAERRADEERALREAVEAVTAAFTIEEGMHAITRSALRATGSDGAFVECIDTEGLEVRVTSAAGVMAFSSGSGNPFEGSLTEEVIERDEPILLPRLSETERQIPGDLKERCGDCSMGVLPLTDGEEAIGALFLVRRPGRQLFQEDELARARTFVQLASLAFRKIHLLNEAERRREEIERLMASRELLVRGFSHDLKNPLGAADGQLQLLEMEVHGRLTAKQREGIERSRRSIKSGLGLIEDLTELARAEAEQLEIERHSVDIREAARETAEEHRGRAEAKGLRMEIRVPTEPTIIESDGRRIHQVIGNLLSNAVKYTEEGVVTVAVEEHGGDGAGAGPPGPGRWVAVYVSDTGPGVPETEQHLLFREFMRLSSGTEPGAGIGLAISERIARALGGTITVESTVGVGSTFTLWLPIDAARSRL